MKTGFKNIGKTKLDLGKNHGGRNATAQAGTQEMGK